MNAHVALSIILIFLPAVILHECAHGWMASKLGDQTARDSGRITLNPLKHIDPFGTVLLPIMLWSLGLTPFGWAKPVPVNPFNLSHPKRDMMWVGLAGPVTNVLIAVVASQLFLLNLSGLGKEFVAMTIYVNLALAVFNMIPIPPLDGSRLVMGLLPNRYAYLYSRLEPYGIVILFAMFWALPMRKIIFPVIDSLAAVLGVK